MVRILYFLTDDEQDINREIKTMNIDEDLVKRELSQLYFPRSYTMKNDSVIQVNILFIQSKNG